MKTKMLGMLLLLSVTATGQAMTPEERKAYTDKLVQILPPVPAGRGGGGDPFTQWLQRTGETVPDFDALPRSNALPDPLTFLDGRPVKNADDWKARRAEIIQLFEKYDIGTIPPKPKIDSITPVDAATAGGAGGAGAGRGRGGATAPATATGPAGTGPATAAATGTGPAGPGLGAGGRGGFGGGRGGLGGGGGGAVAGRWRGRSRRSSISSTGRRARLPRG